MWEQHAWFGYFTFRPLVPYILLKLQSHVNIDQVLSEIHAILRVNVDLSSDLDTAPFYGGWI